MAGVREVDVLNLIYEHVRTTDAGVLLGPGDDLAAIRLGGGVLLAGVDQVIDGVHVLADRISWERIGKKAIHRSVSDIAAMAGTPRACLAAVVLPSTASEHDVELLCKGLHAAAEAVGAPLVGGDVAIHRESDHPLTISVTVLAEASPLGPITRSGARPGDRLYVTGQIGGAVHADGSGHHLDFQPRVAESRALLALIGSDLHAMIDISDGLGRDAGRLAAASNLQVHIDTAAIPCRTGVPLDAAIADGEDYELLFAVPADTTMPESLAGPGGQCPLSRIGTFHSPAGTDEPRVVLSHADGRVEDGTDRGWDHG